MRDLTNVTNKHVVLLRQQFHDESIAERFTETYRVQPLVGL
jgi:hypothetical protein